MLLVLTGSQLHTVCPMQNLDTGLWIMGLVSAGALGVSFLLAVLYMCIALYGNAGRHMRIVALPSACVPPTGAPCLTGPTVTSMYAPGRDIGLHGN